MPTETRIPLSSVPTCSSHQEAQPLVLQSNTAEEIGTPPQLNDFPYSSPKMYPLNFSQTNSLQLSTFPSCSSNSFYQYPPATTSPFPPSSPYRPVWPYSPCAPSHLPYSSSISTSHSSPFVLCNVSVIITLCYGCHNKYKKSEDVH